MDPKQLLTRSISASPYADQITRIMAAALDAVEPGNAVRSQMKRAGDQLIFGKKKYLLNNFKRVLVIGFGKASIPMAEAAIEILGANFTQGIVITKESRQTKTSPSQKLSILEASHPIPDQRSILGANQIVDLLSKTRATDLVICLISGGGSALLTLPAPGIALEDVQQLGKILLECGATISEINTLRKHISQVKGGQLARLAAPAPIVSLILSDVIGDRLDVIASGPTVPDPTTFEQAVAILEKYKVLDQIPKSIYEHLNHGISDKVSETPKVGDPIFKSGHNLIVGNNLLAAHTALQTAKDEGYNSILLTTSMQGEARLVGQILASIARQSATTGDPLSRPACIIAGGETTVTIQGDGLGGRNQELALGAVETIAGIESIMLITLATDGDDGPTDAAGAVVTGETFERAKSMALEPQAFLQANDSYHFFKPLDDLLKPGYTQTNVCDLNFIFVF